jgi:hypothetical protein
MADIGGLENDFGGFGDNFSGFPKRLPEDTVEYSLYIIDRELKSQRDIHSRLEDVRKESLKLTKDLLTDYIWQRDGFRLEMKTEKGMTSARVRKVPTADVATGSMYLHGLTNYGDSVEDEWLIVYILKELSSRFPNLWIKVVDTDGEFLLIEAANALPRWLNPEIADNRVGSHINIKGCGILTILRYGFTTMLFTLYPWVQALIPQQNLPAQYLVHSLLKKLTRLSLLLPRL